jgi:hypothetical protein
LEILNGCCCAATATPALPKLRQKWGKLSTISWNRGNIHPLTLGGNMKALTKEERRAVARRIFETLCEHYPDRYIALVEQQGKVGLAAAVAQSEIADLGVAQDPLG